MYACRRRREIVRSPSHNRQVPIAKPPDIFENNEQRNSTRLPTTFPCSPENSLREKRRELSTTPIRTPFVRRMGSSQPCRMGETNFGRCLRLITTFSTCPLRVTYSASERTAAETYDLKWKNRTSSSSRRNSYVRSLRGYRKREFCACSFFKFICSARWRKTNGARCGTNFPKTRANRKNGKRTIWISCSISSTLQVKHNTRTFKLITLGDFNRNDYSNLRNSFLNGHWPDNTTCRPIDGSYTLRGCRFTLEPFGDDKIACKTAPVALYADLFERTLCTESIRLRDFEFTNVRIVTENRFERTTRVFDTSVLLRVTVRQRFDQYFHFRRRTIEASGQESARFRKRFLTKPYCTALIVYH